jgi:hypothetical protein
MNDYIKQRLPKLVFSLSHRVKFRDSNLAENPMAGHEHVARFDHQTKKLQLLHDAGFFSNCTVTLQNLAFVHPTDTRIQVVWGRQEGWREQGRNRENLFEDYFQQATIAEKNDFLPFIPRFDHHGVYEDLDYRKLNAFIKHYFTPSSFVNQRIEEFKSKYKICPQNTIGVCYRGTDKCVEVSSILPECYVEETRKLLRHHPNMTVLIQTDQAQVRDLFCREFSERVVYIQETPATRSATVIHQLPPEQLGISKYELGVNLLAAVNILSQCHYVITHTGNVGLWIYLFRGSPHNSCQLRPKASGGYQAVVLTDLDRGFRRSVSKWLRRVSINQR